MSLDQSLYESFLYEAKLGDPSSQRMIVIHHAYGQTDPTDPPVNIEEGKFWGKKLAESANNGNYLAMAHIIFASDTPTCSMIFPGISISDIAAIHDTYKKQISAGAQKSIPDAMYALAFLAESDKLSLMKAAAEAGSSLACYALAFDFSNYGEYYSSNLVTEKDLHLAEYYAVMGSKASDIYAPRCILLLAHIRQERYGWSDENPEYLSLVRKAASSGDYRVVKELNNIDRIPELINSITTPPKRSATSSGGCYIATSVYGSYDCPEVWVLRRYRDNVLDKNVFGRLFIRIYYATSPTLVRLFGKCSWFKKLWKPWLDKKIAELKTKGFSEEPYNDKH